ncbi:hypothetical protein Ocin01_05471 [Orchesella cincta]|uniref:Uncharacterized protein n=1 Tax=Orchesella cincta TaxID=48709 RepID=A0A1D2N7F7_ORCCI|nr:hypothetical protein Ocin01_05471 [Orchesella cincta]
MSSSGPNYSVDNQISFIVQWFRTWSELQKDDFVEILAQKLGPGSNMNGLVNGMQNLDTGAKRVSLFSCQIKLFNDWWVTWNESEKENLTTRLKESDPKFWATVQEELNGTRKKLEDDFFLSVNTCVGSDSSSNNTSGQRITIETAEAADVVSVSTNGVNHEEGPSLVDDEQDLVENICVNGLANGEEEETEEMEDVDASG